ncbi:hypothetical protein [Chenggangzhangella methanolivorans]|uniref:CopL family metal-binding regulatory protein n=1 Tax=Chenggangzhangella methanolivorans TaxID=1437009 RepID=A0A9E6R7G9_9HYPH|nr:hypothetical protein [Chenggangzhangella methanolivorans]QZN99617.1 hypothetical protein K6K41_23455 [Chenggangzhangella methanolivorans]
MTVRSLLRIAAGLALALFVAMSWATPSEAHGAPAAATQQAEDYAATSDVVASTPDQGMEATSSDCTGHMGQSGSGKTTCCSNTCHAAISTEMEPLQAVTLKVTVLPAVPAKAALSGPTVHIKRPPRTSAALVG